MAQFVIFHQGAFNIYSTMSDIPVFWRGVTLQELAEYMRYVYPAVTADHFWTVIKAAVKTGSSGGYDWQAMPEVMDLNRAGENGTQLSREEFLRRYLSFHNNPPPPPPPPPLAHLPLREPYR